MFICKQCGYQSFKWYGQCPKCKTWGSLTEVEKTESKTYTTTTNLPKLKFLTIKEIKTPSDIRIKTGLQELDKILGNGLYKGSVLLLGGEPGIGKSTLSLQIAGKIANNIKERYL